MSKERLKVNRIEANFPAAFMLGIFLIFLFIVTFIHYGYLYIQKIGNDEIVLNQEKSLLQFKLCLQEYISLIEREFYPNKKFIKNIENPYQKIKKHIEESYEEIKGEINHSQLYNLYEAYREIDLNMSKKDARDKVNILKEHKKSFENFLSTIRRKEWKLGLNNLILKSVLYLFKFLFGAIIAYLVIASFAKWIKHVWGKAPATWAWFLISFISALIAINFLIDKPLNETNYVGFEFNKEQYSIEIIEDPILMTGFRVGIGILYLIPFHIFLLFPAILQGYLIQEPATYPSIKKASVAAKKIFSGIFGLSKYYHFYLRSVYHESGISILIGLMALLMISTIPFFFSSAAYFTIPPFWNFLSSYSKPSYIIYSIIAGFVLSALGIVFIYIKKFPHINMLKIIYSFCILLIIILCFYFLGKIDYSRFKYFLFIIQQRGISHFKAFPAIPLLSITVAAFVLWYSPIVTAFSSTDSKFTAQTRRVLRHTLQLLRNHIVILGYGDLGKKVCSGIVKRTITQNKKFNGITEVISTQTEEFIKCSTDLVLVDKDESAFNEIHTDPNYGKIGLGNIEVGKEKIAVLGIVGDCKSPEILDKANLDFSNLVILTARDEKATFPISNYIQDNLEKQKEKKKEEKEAKEGKKERTGDEPKDKRNSDTISIYYPKAIIGAENSLYGSYLEWRNIENDIFFFYPAQLRGMAVGEILFKSLIKRSDTSEEFDKLMILGRGRQLYYIVEKLWVNFMKYSNKKKDGDYFINNNVVIVSDEEYIKDHGVVKHKKGESRLDEGKWFLPSSKMSSGFPVSNWKIHTYFNSPSHTVVLREVLIKEKPGIIGVVSDSSDDTLHIVQELLSVLEHIQDKFLPPLIIVGVRETEKHAVGDAIFYWRCLSNDRLSYPLQQQDTIVDLYDDASEMIIGMVEVLSSIDKKNNISAIELSFCIEDIRGNLAEIFSNLAGLSFKSPDDQGHNVPSFHSYDSANMISPKIPEGYFCFISTATLVNIGTFKEDAFKANKLIKNEYLSDQLDFSKSAKDSVRELLISASDDKGLNQIKSLLSNIIPSKELSFEQINFSPSECVIKKLCPMCIYRHHLFTRYTKLNWRKEATKSIIMREKDQKALNHFIQGGSKRITKREQNVETLAQIAICGDKSEGYGSMARVINTLLFRIEIEPKCNNDRSIDNRVLNIKYTRCYKCHNPAINFIKIYGNLVSKEENRLEELSENTCINAILIRIISEKGVNAWEKYATKLLNAIRNTTKKNNFIGKISAKHRIILIINLDLINKEKKDIGPRAEGKNKDDIFNFLETQKNCCTERKDACPFNRLKTETQEIQRIEWKDIKIN